MMHKEFRWLNHFRLLVECLPFCAITYGQDYLQSAVFLITLRSLLGLLLYECFDIVTMST